MLSLPLFDVFNAKSFRLFTSSTPNRTLEKKNFGCNVTRTRTQLTDVDKGKILALIEIMSAEQVAREMGRDPTTVRRFLAKYKRTRKIENLPRSGRPQALNKQEKNALLREVMKKRRKPLADIVNDLGLRYGLTTAARTLHNLGVRSHVAAKKPFISEDNATTRISWCEKKK